jgi:hypothetical protein
MMIPRIYAALEREFANGPTLSRRGDEIRIDADGRTWTVTVTTTKGDSMSNTTWTIGQRGEHATYNPCTIFDGDGNSICMVYGIPTNYTLDDLLNDRKSRARYRKGLRNASLLSAAPDLLAAIEALKAAAKNNNRGLAAALELADAAIAKAKAFPAVLPLVR